MSVFNEVTTQMLTNELNKPNSHSIDTQPLTTVECFAWLLGGTIKSVQYQNTYWRIIWFRGFWYQSSEMDFIREPKYLFEIMELMEDEGFFCDLHVERAEGHRHLIHYYSNVWDGERYIVTVRGTTRANSLASALVLICRYFVDIRINKKPKEETNLYNKDRIAFAEKKAEETTTNTALEIIT